MALKIMSLVKSNSDKHNYVIWTKLPDGINYFQGIHEAAMPTKGGKMPAMFNIWTIHFDDLKKFAGLFTKEEAEFYLKNMGMDGCNICTHKEAAEMRKKELN